MNNNRTNHRARRPWLAIVAALAAFLVACGGGGGGGGIAAVGSGGTGAVFSGTISGFGSVIVNNVRIDDSTATVTLDDDSIARSLDLKLGMVVEIEGQKDDSGTTGKATSISGYSQVQGPVSAINLAGNQLTVLGVVVTVTPATTFDGAGVTGLGSLAANNIVEIYGIRDASGGVKATRIERKTATTEVRLVGTVQNSSATTFTLNGITVQYLPANLVNLQNGISNGSVVRVKGTLSAPTTIVASKVRAISLTPAIKEGEQVELEGIVTKFTSATDFEVNGLRVTIPGSAKQQGTPALGARIEVEGAVRNNILVATKVEVKDDTQVKADANEVTSTISSIDTPNKTFTLRSGTVTVKWDSNTRFDDSTLPRGAADLTVNASVEVKGQVTGNVLLASKIELKK
jgi:hypothetical protein